MKKCLLLVLLFLGLGATGTMGQSASVTFARETDFSKYKTFKWVPIQAQLKLDDLSAEQLVGTLEVALAKKGLTKSPSEQADLLIGYQITPEGDKHFAQSAVGASYGSAAGASSGNGSISVTRVHSGQLVLDMYDAERKQLVWRGIMEDVFDPEAKPDKKQKHMDKAIEKLLKEYPPQRK